MKGWLRRAGRPFLLVAGLAFAGFLVWHVGTEKVADVLRLAGIWLPVVALLEMGFVATDIVGLRVLLGPANVQKISRTSWVRSTTLAYASTILLPTGRAAGEATRATLLARDVGVGVAAGVCVRLQAAVLVANAVISVLIAGVLVAWRGSATTALSVAMLGNALACTVLGTLLYAILRGKGLSRWIQRRIPWVARKLAGDKAVAEGAAVSATPGRAQIVGSIIAGIVGRCVQTAQFAVVMHAVGGLFTIPAAMTAQAVQIVGSTVGDALPAQLGAAEASYYECASMLGLGSDPARAISIRILVLTAQIGLAVVCLLVAARRQWGAAESERNAASSSAQGGLR